MSSPAQSLTNLRHQIDSIDDQLHDLLMQRSRLSGQVFLAKERNSMVLRPAREAQILRRLVKRHSGAIPRTVVARIWREIISASTAQQSHFAVAVLGEPGAHSLFDIARGHFGVATPISVMGTAGGVIRAVTDGSATVGLLPWPTLDEPYPWWNLIAQDGPQVPRIVARLPFVQASPPIEEALAISLAPNEPTGADNSFLMLQSAGELSRGSLKDRLDSVGLTSTEIFSHPDKAEHSHLVHVSGYVDQEAPALSGLVARATGFAKALALGAYAVPLTAKDLGAA